MKKKNNSGFFLIEVVIATAVIATVLVILLGAISNSIDIASLALQRTQASYLLEEGAEAMKVYRDITWTNIDGLSYNTTYYLQWTGTYWLPTATLQSSGIFTRTVICYAALRDSNNDIVTTGGTTDSGTRKCTISVSWPSYSGTKTEALSLYVANIH